MALPPGAGVRSAVPDGRLRGGGSASADARDSLLAIVAGQKRGEHRGIASICSAHPVVLRAAMKQAAEDGGPLLVEATANQVNQFGGYSGMDHAAFRRLVEGVAADVGFPVERIILGGDHLGPYPWRSGPPERAMQHARDLLAAAVRAGYTKLHLDTSMPLRGDTVDGAGRLDPERTAARQADLAAVAEAAFAASAAGDEALLPPLYVIGSEVPPPGGIPAGAGAVPVTTAADLLATVSASAEAFRSAGLDAAWARTIAVVAQAGVEFGDHEVHAYDPVAAQALCAAARTIPGIVLEGHSTDHQAPAALRRLVEDGVAILKVGPALTFALRECLFALEAIERELAGRSPGAELSCLMATLDEAMLADPIHWRGYAAGDDPEQAISRRFSYSDRSRYYWFVPAVRRAIDVLMANLTRSPIPPTLLSQFLPLQYRAVREGRLADRPADLLEDAVRVVLRGYSAAVGGP